MKILIQRFLVLLITFTCSAHASLYKGLDEEGNVTYSDTPFENAEKMTPPPITVLDAPKKAPAAAPKAEKEGSDKVVETTYKNFKISAPKNGQTIWNVPDLTVAVQMTPSLNTEQGHTVWLLMDGKILAKNSRSMLMQIGRADRGQHKLQAQIRNKKGKVINKSKSITIHIKNTVVTRPAPR